jgi:hypothetical protein
MKQLEPRRRRQARDGNGFLRALRETAILFALAGVIAFLLWTMS